MNPIRLNPGLIPVVMHPSQQQQLLENGWEKTTVQALVLGPLALSLALPSLRPEWSEPVEKPVSLAHLWPLSVKTMPVLSLAETLIPELPKPKWLPLMPMREKRLMREAMKLLMPWPLHVERKSQRANKRRLRFETNRALRLWKQASKRAGRVAP